MLTDAQLCITEILGLRNSMGMNFELIHKYSDKINITDDLLEIGSDRGEGSTGVLASIAVSNNKILHSVDMNAKIISRNSNKYKEQPVIFYNTKGEDFLDQHSHLKFSIVLLDNFDWNWAPLEATEDYILEQMKEYETIYNLTMTNINSQQAHLVQALKLTNMLAKQCVVVCDDTFINRQGTYDGKCGAAIPYLLTLGFVAHKVHDVGFILVRI